MDLPAWPWRASAPVVAAFVLVVAVLAVLTVVGTGWVGGLWGAATSPRWC